MNTDVSGVSSVISGTLSNVLSNLATVVTTLVALFGMNVKMAVIGVLVIPLLILPTRSAGRTRWKLLSESQAKHEELLQQGGVYQKLFETQFGRMLNQEEE